MTDTTIIRKSPAWMKILLVLSLALNLLILGAIGSKLFWHRGPATMDPAFAGKYGHLARPEIMHRTGRALLWKLPRKKRRQIIALALANRRALAPQLRELAMARREFAELVQNPHSEAELAAAIEKMQKAQSTLLTQSNQLTGSFIKALTPEQRALYGKLLLAPPHRHSWGWTRHRW